MAFPTYCVNIDLWPVDSSVEEMFDVKPDEIVMTFPAVEDEADKTADISKCPGCKRQQSKNDPLHTRVPGECRWPFATTIHWECPACQAKLPFRNGNHTIEIGKCKFAATSGKTRSGAHPRAPGLPAQSSPASDLQAQDLDGKDINADVEIPPDTRPKGSCSKDK